MTDQGELEFDKVMFAIGRVPNTDKLNLESIGVNLNRGAICVDDYNKTNIDNIYAIGDCINLCNFTPVAVKEGRILAERLYGGK